MAKYEPTSIQVLVVPFKFLPVGAYFHRVLPYQDTQEWVLHSSRILVKWQAGSAEAYTGRALNGQVENIGPDEVVRQLFIRGES